MVRGDEGLCRTIFSYLSCVYIWPGMPSETDKESGTLIYSHMRWEIAVVDSVERTEE